MDREELRAWIAQHPNAVRATDLFTLLEAYGWTLDRVRGSHHIFRRPGWPRFSVPVHGSSIRPVYVRQGLARAIGDDDDHD